MEDLLTTRQVLNILKVDRITVYRMLQDGRIKGVKIGQQWRFPRKEVDRILLNADQAEPEIIQPHPQARSGSFPAHCLQTIHDLFSFVAQVSSMIIDSEGNPITEISQPCRYCQIILQSLPGLAACQESWKEIAKHSNTGSRYFTCHAGLQYISAPIIDREKTVGYFLVGEFYWQAPSEQEVSDHAHALASGHNLSQETLSQAANTIPVIEKDQHARVESWPIAAARAVQTILQERTGLIDRLQQIADLSKID